MTIFQVSKRETTQADRHSFTERRNQGLTKLTILCPSSVFNFFLPRSDLQGCWWMFSCTQQQKNQGEPSSQELIAAMTFSLSFRSRSKISIRKLTVWMMYIHRQRTYILHKAHSIPSSQGGSTNPKCRPCTGDAKCLHDCRFLK